MGQIGRRRVEELRVAIRAAEVVQRRYLLEEITTTGKRVLAELARKRNADERAAAE